MYCRFIASACCVFIFISTFAQDTHYTKKGDVYMKRGDYTNAAAYYKKAADANINDVRAKEKLARALVALGDYQSAEAVYQLLATSPMASDTNKFYYAQILNRNGKYEVAALNYKAYFEARPYDPLAGEYKDFMTKVMALRQADKRYQLTDIPENTSGSDEGPTFCVYNFCYTSNGHSSGAQKEKYDLYILRGANPANPSPQKLIDKASWRKNENAATFTNDGREMIFTRSNYGHRNHDGSIKLGLYHADYDSTGRGWVNIVPLAFIDYKYNFMQPSLSKDGSKLFFASDMPGGFGETDIYVCTKQGNTWSAPVNLGKGINSIGREETPFMANNGTLYFASDAHIGLGGLDIYSATLTDTTWGNAINAGAPINSAYDDFGYVNDPTGHSGYIVSNRPGGMGDNDIYHFTIGTDFLSAGSETPVDRDLQEKSIELVVNVEQQGAGKLQNVNAVLFNPATGKKIEQVSDSDGYIEFAAEINQEYVLKVFKTDMKQGGYEIFVRPISTLGLRPGQTIKEDAQLIYHEKMEETGVVATSTAAAVNDEAVGGRTTISSAELPVVYFDLGEYSLNAVSKSKLDVIANMMKMTPKMEMEISSNTDASGKLQANMALSAKRSLACLNYLTAKGISKTRFIAVGYGDKKPVSNCSHCTAAEQAKNRRTEFKIIKQ